MDSQLHIDQFLMFNLSEICTEIDDQELRAYALTMTLAAFGNNLPESMLKMYLCPCDIDKDQINIHLSAFLGMNLISLECDCINKVSECMYQQLIDHQAFSLGKSFLQNETMEYLDARDRVVALKQDLEL